jgi:hypothetical protein
MERAFKKVTKKKLKEMACIFYGAGKELQVNDKVYIGYTVNYANLNGTSSSIFNRNDISLSLKMFVEKDGMLYELYKI